MKFDFVVLGAGLAGLSFAKRISENGYSVLILEKHAKIGGLSRSLYHKGYYLDFCAHRFHTKNRELLEEIKSLPGLELKKHQKKSRIFMFNKYLKFPFQLQNLLRAMPFYQSLICGFSFLLNSFIRKIQKQKKIKSYKDWFIYLYGIRLYEIMCRPYTCKIWRVDPGNISADWAQERFKGESLRQVSKRIFYKLLTLNFSNFNKEDEELMPDGGDFYYPLRGIQELCDAIADEAEQHQAEIKTSAIITKIDRANTTVSFVSEKNQVEVHYSNLISTIPLNEFYDLQQKHNSEITELISKFKYLNIILVYAFVDSERISNDHWIYFPDEDIVFNRAVEFSNWSPEMCPKGKTAICFDITSYQNDTIWKKQDSEIVDRTINDAIRTGYLPDDCILSTLVYRLENAYPFYDIDYKSRLNKIIPFLESDNCFLLGRTGLFRYNNADNSIEMGFKLAENFINNEQKKSVYNYKFKEISI